MMKINKKGVTLPELFAYIIISSIIGTIILSGIVLAYGNYKDVASENSILEEVNLYNLTMKSQFDYKYFDDVSLCPTEDFDDSCILFTNTETNETFKIELAIETDTFNFFNFKINDKIINTSLNVSLESKLKISEHTKTCDIYSTDHCDSAIIEIYLKVETKGSNKRSKQFNFTLSI